MYDFDRLNERRNTNSLKWDVEENELPMWVADMDFMTAPEVVEAIKEKAARGIFGYEIVPEEWYQAVQGWWRKRHSFVIEREWMMFCTGVVAAISSIIRKLTTPGENVVVQTPVYNIFFNSIVNNGRNILDNTLVYTEDGYQVDFEDLEKKLADPQTTLMILCNPQNPGGKVWERETLKRIGELCEKYHVIVVSDEIHCDITDPGCEYTPFTSVSDSCRNNCIMCIAPTKVFNIAGLQTSAIVVPSEHIRTRVNRSINTDEVAEPNSLAITAAVAAFTKGDKWVDELRQYIFDNKQYVIDYISKNIPEIKVAKAQATYLLWLDCSELLAKMENMGTNTAQTGNAQSGIICSEGCDSSHSLRLSAYIRHKTGLYLSDGLDYGECGRNFMRMNIGCPRSRLEEGLERLKKAVGDGHQ